MRMFALAAAAALVLSYSSAMADGFATTASINVGAGSAIAGGGSIGLEEGFGPWSIGGELQAEGFSAPELRSLEAVAARGGYRFPLAGKTITVAAFGGVGEAQGAGDHAAFVAGADLDLLPQGGNVGGGLRYEHVAAFDVARFGGRPADADLILARLTYRP
ncbi:MAG TPA: hypothetical protein VHC68_01335 [Candidatus Paceibacterota bacterium]|nr:hypothetical protein [Candidatus Paceibacterota bacterium]